MLNKYSYGIALCRYNKEKNNRIEILLIKKRYTYQYYNFIYGKYNIKNKKQIQNLFDNMTYYEKIEILSFNFENMWYRLWLERPNKKIYLENILNKKSNNDLNIISNNNLNKKNVQKLYYKKKNIFEKNFLNKKEELINYIKNSKSFDIMWEIPKGKKLRSLRENNIDCAVREFEEETNIKPNNYEILYDINPIIEIIEDENVRYNHLYYIAKSNNNIKPKLKFDNFDQVKEISKIKWISLSELDFLDLSKNINKILLKTFKKILNKIKKSKNKNIILLE
jgi:8-oxo-dGTP pyrophosphatase MutT (NUDIX family)